MRFPFFIRFAKLILRNKLARFGKYIIFLNHWEDVNFFQVPWWQALKFFLASRKQFTEGMAKGQEEVFSREAKDIERLANTMGIKVVQTGGCPANWHPVGIRDWHGNN